MNINNLKNEWLKDTNKEWKYKEICEYLEEEEKGRGNSRNSQMEDWKRYFYFYKPNPKGQKFIITEFYEDIKPKVDNRGKNENSHGNNRAEYIKNIEKLILDLVTREGINGKVFLSKNMLLKTLKMVNDNYSFCQQRIPKLSKFMSVDKATVQEWYDSTSSMLESNLETALKSLEKQSLILWSREITVAEAKPIAKIHNDTEIVKNVKKDKYGEETINYLYKVNDSVILDHREATDQEKKFILHTEREILREMGFDNKGKIIACGLWEEFSNKVNDIVLKELQVAFYYKSYKILFNDEHIFEVIEDIYDLELEDSVREKHENILNQGVDDRIHNNVIKKHEKAQEEMDKYFGKAEDERLLRRTSQYYIRENDELNNNLINLEAKNIKECIRRTNVNVL